MISLYRFNDEVKHIKVIEKDSWIHITEAKKFESLLVSHIKLFKKKRKKVTYWTANTELVVNVKAEKFTFLYPVTLQELVEYYQSHSLKESFKLLDTTLRYPYKSRERSLTRANTRSPGKPFEFFSVPILYFPLLQPFWYRIAAKQHNLLVPENHIRSLSNEQLSTASW